MNKRKILFIHPFGDWPWARQIPNPDRIWGDNVFVFDQHEKNPDWIVVYGGLREDVRLRHNASKTLFISGEPPTFQKYNPKFLRQFAGIITVDENITGDNIIHGQPGLPWHVGMSVGKIDAYASALTYDELQKPVGKKTKLASVICSTKVFTSFHRKRIEFIMELQSALGDRVDFFGRGINEIDDKEEALRDYRYHIAIENAQIPHYFTEKITDSFLRGTYPIYCGAPNIHDYFPSDSCALFDISVTDKAICRIADILNSDMDRKNRSAVRKAKRLCLAKYNIFPAIINYIDTIERDAKAAPDVWRNELYRERSTFNAMLKQNFLYRFRQGIYKLSGAYTGSASVIIRK